jgi:hypothetical protein
MRESMFFPLGWVQRPDAFKSLMKPFGVISKILNWGNIPKQPDKDNNLFNFPKVFGPTGILGKVIISVCFFMCGLLFNMVSGMFIYIE